MDTQRFPFAQVFPIWHAQRGDPTALSYDLDTQVIYCPTPSPDPSYVFDFMHEWSHAQLAQGLHGIILEHLRGQLDIVGRPIVDQVWGFVSEATATDESARTRLLIDGELPVLSSRASAGLRNLRATPPLSTNVEVFLELNRRRRALLDAFHDVHEGVAVHTSISLSLTELDDPEDWLGAVIRTLEADSGAKAPTDIKPRLRAIASREAERWEHGIYGGTHAEGVRLFRELASLGSTFDDVWLFALPAMHVPYAGALPFDMEPDVFDQWIAAYRGRFANLLRTPDRLRELAARVREVGTIEPKVQTELLRLADPTGTVPSGAPLGAWLRRAIWESRLFRRFLDAYDVPLDATTPTIASIEGKFPDDRSSTFLLTQYGDPGRVDQDGQIHVRDPEQRATVEDRIATACGIAATDQIIRRIDALPR